MSMWATPWFDRSTPAPRAWPPPTQANLLDVLRGIRTRDRHGHALHVGAAVLFAFLAPLDQGPNSVASIVLLSVAAVRMVVFPALGTALLRWPPLWLAAAWVGWMALSAAWSGGTSHHADGSPENHPLRLIAGQRMLLAVVALFPVIEASRAIAWALIASAATNGAVQVAQKFGVLLPPKGASWRPSGIVALPAVAAMNAGSAILLATALWTRERLAGRAALAVALALCAAGMALAASRQPLLALVPSLLILATMLVVHGFARPRAVVAGLAAMALLALLATLATGGAVVRYLAAAQQEAEAAMRGEVGFSSIHLRLHWWRLGLEQWMAHPWTGGGLGSFTGFVAAHPDTADFMARSGISEREMLQAHPHSTYVRALAETGLVGFALLAALLATVLRAALRNAADAAQRTVRRAPVEVVGACAALCFLLLSTAAECVELMNVAYAHLAVIVALCALPRARGT